MVRARAGGEGVRLSVLPGVGSCGRIATTGPARRHGRVHVGHLALHQLEVADGLSELLPRVDVREHLVKRGLHQAERPAGQHEPLKVEPGHKHVDALVKPTEDVLGGDTTVLEDELAGVRPAHPELVQFLRRAEPGHALLDQKG